MPVCQEKRVAAQAFAGVCKPPLGGLIKKRFKGLKVQGGGGGDGATDYIDFQLEELQL